MISPLNSEIQRSTLVLNGLRVQAVIFDIDGTLVDSFPTLCAAFNAGIHHLGLEPIPERLLIHCFKKNMNLVETLRKLLSSSLDESLIERCRAEILLQYRRAEMEQVRPFTGALDLLDSLKKQNVKVGIATGRTSQPETEWIRFRRYGLVGYIDALVTSAEVSARKPAPDAILECAERLKVPIDRCLVVGDTPLDILAAKRAGAIPVAIASEEDLAETFGIENPGLVFRTLHAFASFLIDGKERSNVLETPSGGDTTAIPLVREDLRRR